MAQLETDYLVLGTGIAGLAFAIDAAAHGEVTIVTKRGAIDTNTNCAQGGVAAVLADDDSFEQHVADTLTVGDGLCDRKVVEGIIAELFAKDARGLLEFTRVTGALIQSICELRRPVIAAINGVCVGAGAVIAAACDLRIAAETSRFGFIFPKVGLSGADMGASFLLPRIVGRGRAAELLFSAASSPRRRPIASASSTRCCPRRRCAEMVKLEGAGHKLDVIRFLVERDIPVCAHLGLTPQSVLKFGVTRCRGRNEAAAARLREEARAVADAGAQLLVLECVPSSLAAAITADLAIPTIGIGAGQGCDGQVLVLHDFLGLDTGHRRPKFVKDFLAEGGSVAGAVRAYADAVRSGAFPDDAHSY